MTKLESRPVQGNPGRRCSTWMFLPTCRPWPCRLPCWELTQDHLLHQGARAATRAKTSPTAVPPVLRKLMGSGSLPAHKGEPRLPLCSLRLPVRRGPVPCPSLPALNCPSTLSRDPGSWRCCLFHSPSGHLLLLRPLCCLLAFYRLAFI